MLDVLGPFVVSVVLGLPWALTVGCGEADGNTGGTPAMFGGGGSGPGGGASSADAGDTPGGQGAGGDDGNVGDGSGAWRGLDPNTASDFEICAAHFTAACDRIVECGGRERSVCMTRIDGCPDRLFAPGSTWTNAAVLDCAGEWANFACDKVVLDKSPECFLRAGSVPLGAACIANDQCQSFSCSGAITSSRCGECLPGLEPGASCIRNLDCADEGVGTRCSDGGICLPAAEGIFCYEGRCSDHNPQGPRPAEGAACAAYGCEEQAFCEANSDGSEGGLCRARPGLGETCGIQAREGNKMCAEGTTCVASLGNVCSPLRTVGESCGDVEGQCVADGYCVAGACAARRTAGEQCNRSRSYGVVVDICEQTLECLCVADNCAPAYCGVRRGPGESCDGRTEVCSPGLICESGACASDDDRRLFESACMP